jgi:hypothetical protein
MVLAASRLLIVGTLVAGCSVYDASLVESKDAPLPENEWGSGLGWWSRKAADGCVRAGVPTVNDRPKNATGDGGPVLQFALRNMALGSLGRDQEPSREAWQSLGFDLDGLCTQSVTCPRPPEFPCVTAGLSVLDGFACRDNNFGRLASETVAASGIGTTVGLSNDGFNCSLCNGIYNFVIQLSQWNGEPNDSNVRIDFYPSPGIETLPAWQCRLDTEPGAWRGNACWTKADRFLLKRDSFAGSLTPGAGLPPANLNDPSAYGKDGYVVGQLPPNTSLWFPGDRGEVRALPLNVQQGVFAGKLVQKDGVWRIEDGTIAGRSRGSDMIKAFRDLGFCEDHTLYGLMESFVTGNLDVLSSGANSPDAACDALSVGIGFEAEEATVSYTAVTVADLPGCTLPPGG